MRYNCTRFLSAIVIALFFLAFVLASCARKPEYPATPSSEGEIKFSISELEEGKPLFRSLEHEGTRINYFVLKVNGVVESYFDACSRCYPKKLGYRVDGKELVCVACGERFPIDGLKGLGSCHPLPIKGTVAGDSYVIDVEEIIRGTVYF